MKVAVVANPTSGRGKGASVIPRVESILRSLGVEHTIHISRSAADPERLARAAAADGADVVAALGGDGHIGACVNGVMNAGSSAALAVIPAGTGNDFAQLIGMNPKEPLRAVQVLREPTVKRIDVVRLKLPQGERYYVNVAGAGFDSEANAYANRMRWFRGKTRYVIATFILLPGFRAARFQITVDGEHHDAPGMLIAVGNGRSYGGGMRVCPDAKVDDGVLDITVVGEVSKPDFIKTFPKVFTGRHINHPKVHQLRGAEVSITAERTLQVFADGEHAGTLPATFTVVPSALAVVVRAEEERT
ncbi:MAG: diacylglycerol kinase family lipid kinase [Actinomycetota bacterium]|nr:diacylglycerol kinase family lipid kinase [Actinomycetota bacterium]